MSNTGSTIGGLGGTVIGGPIGGAVGSAIGGLFGHKNKINPMDVYRQGAAGFDSTMAGLKSGFDPYINTGTSQLDPLSNQYSQLMDDPTQKINQWMGSYQQSPYAKFQENEIAKQLGRQSAATGTFGGPASQRALAGYTQGIIGKDMQNYLGHVQSLYGQGLSGSMGLAGMGLQGQSTYAGLSEDAEKAKLSALMGAAGAGMKQQAQDSADTMKGIGAFGGLLKDSPMWNKFQNKTGLSGISGVR